MPVLAANNPASAFVHFQNSQTVQVPTDAPVAAPEPARSGDVMVTTPQMPVCTDAAPMTLVVAVQGTEAIQMMANTTESAPSPLSATMVFVVVVILSIQMPLSPNDNPAVSVPSLAH